jgi:hypothetical protein
MKQISAVEWLIDEHFGGIENCTPDFRFHIQQAKEMEKEQIIHTYDEGVLKGQLFIEPINGEQYYNTKFKSE